jgi:hypothetical protein
MALTASYADAVPRLSRGLRRSTRPPGVLRPSSISTESVYTRHSEAARYGASQQNLVSLPFELQERITSELLGASC